MPSSTKRQRELARAKWERRQRERDIARQRRRRRWQIVGSALSVVVVAALAFYLVNGPGDDEEGGPPADEDLTAENTPVTCTYQEAEVDTGGKEVALPPSTAATTGTHTATITTNQGVIEIALDAAAAPCTVNSFIHLATSGFYDGTNCHRMLVGEGGNVLQCGDPTGTGTGGPGYQFTDENLAGATYTAGVVAMANSGPNTNGSQFFMVFDDSPFDPNYTPFGQITSGLDVLQAIAEGGVDGDKPKTETTIESVTVSST